MKKFYCFYCQENIKPLGFWRLKFCPKCRRFVTDSGDGFYKVCDNCGANLPVDAARCLQCGYKFNNGNAVEEYDSAALGKKWFDGFLGAIFLLLSIIIGFGILYLSFYAAFFIFIVGLIWFLFNALRLRMRL